MKIKYILSLVSPILYTLSVFAQPPVPLVTLDELETRLVNGRDTTFVINLWATWCAPCVAEMPHFDHFQTVYSNEPVRVLFVSLDAVAQRDAVAAFIEGKQIKSEVVLLNERNQQYYIPKISTEWSGAIPATLFVNSRKGIRAFKEQEFDYEQLETSYLTITQN